MHILSNKQLHAADAYTIATQNIRSADLMERAAEACSDWLLKTQPTDAVYGILCGPGNNGGDGWAIARMLKNAGKEVQVFALPARETIDDNALNKSRYLVDGADHHKLVQNSAGTMEGITVIVDALFGSGLNRPLEDELAEIIRSINHLKVQRIAIDAPSGFFTDVPMPAKAEAICAHHTLCFHAPRLQYLFPESQRWVGNWHVLDIGLIEPDEDTFKDDPFSNYHYTLLPDLKKHLHKPGHFAHKGSNGHALIVGGSHGKTGAVILATKACLRSGVGLCTAYIPAESYAILQGAVPEAMVFTSEQPQHLSGSFNPEPFAAVGFGPGAGQHEDTAQMLKNLLQNTAYSLLIDADGLNILAENPTWLAFLPDNTVLTPHPGELDRLCGKADSGFERLENARELSRKTGSIVVLKGAYTAVCSPSGEVHFNSTGNPGMAKGGTGDALSGIITALLARGIPALHAARLGVFVHGLAGDIAAERLGFIGMQASDLIEALPVAWMSMYEE